MILQQLCKDADRLVGDLPPAMYDVKPVRWVVYLHANGSAEWPPQATSGGERKKDRGKPRLVPFKGRTMAVQPLLLADKVTYTWGQPTDHKRAAQEHAAYLDLLDRCAAKTENADVALIARFLREWDPERQPLPEEMLPDQLTTFAVDERFPIDDPAVRRFWAAEVSGDEGAGTPGQCLVCGLETQLVDRLPMPLKGIPNGQASGVHLVSANASAFESYGRAAALTSSICQSCGERFGKAANALLQNEKTRLRIGPAAYLFWAPEGGGDWVVGLLDKPQPEEVKALLQSPQAGRLTDTIADQPFYAVSITAAISRAVVRSWLHTTVGAAREKIRRWFQWQKITDAYGAEGAALSIFRLAASVYREAKDIVPRVPDCLIRAAVHGEPLPLWLLAQAVSRNLADRDITYPRAALIKAVLCSLKKEDPERMTMLDPQNDRPSYHCGRLLAELEEIQRLAIPGIKATLVDRYYSGASTAPARVFGALLNGSQAHLSKLRKENMGAYHRLSAALEEILGSLQGFPRTLTVQDQALFSLGYYHQRAHDRAARRAAGEQKRARQDENGSTAKEDGND